MAFIDAEDGRQIYYEHHRGSGRPVLLIHGWGMSARVWDTTLAALRERGHSVVMFDQRGSGLSDKDFTDFSVAASAGDAVALVEHLGLDGVVVNGWSLGGAIATETAHRLGTRCSGLVLTCGASPRYTQTDGFPHGGTVDDVRATLAAARPNRAVFFHNLARMVAAKPLGQPTEDWLWSIFMQTAPGADAALLDLAALDQRAILAALAVPVLSIVGSDDTFTPPAIGIAAAELARGGRVVRFEGCGHAPFIEDYDRYCAELIGFLEAIG